MDKTMIVRPGASCSFDSSMIRCSISHSQLLALKVQRKVHFHNTQRGHFRVAVKGTY
jgi:hypothetical protein